MTPADTSGGFDAEIGEKMCTAIAKKGKDLIYGFNLDIDPAVWNFGLYKTKDYFTVGITVGSTTYFTHGVHKDGRFGNVPYMNGEVFAAPKGVRRERIDLINDRYIRGKYSFTDIQKILTEKTVVCVPAATMHSLIGNGEGEMLLVEPGYGSRAIQDDYAVLTNFPVLANLTDYSNPFYGKDRYDVAEAALKMSAPDFSAQDALTLLEKVKQTGPWGTRLSFVYTKNENAVYYCLNGDFSNIQIHRFAAPAFGKCQ